MSLERRDFLCSLAAAGLGAAATATAAPAAPAKADATLTHDRGAFPPEWLGKEQIAMLLYPEFTALDLVGPQYMFANLWGARCTWWPPPAIRCAATPASASSLR